MNNTKPTFSVAVVIPAYRVAQEILSVLEAIPDFVQWVIVVNDCSPDTTALIVEKQMKKDPRIILVSHEKNQGVGGAMRSGYKKALELEADIVVKVDGDGQMFPSDIAKLIAPLIHGKADFTKGNRFRNFNALNKMPLLRRLGNIGLSFLVKAATGYWTCFDPTNGFLAMRTDVLRNINLEELNKGYFFEISQLGTIYLAGAAVVDVPLPARYANETSSLNIQKVLFEFPPLLLKMFARRILLRHFVFDFSMFGIYLLTGLPLILFGLIFGINRWMHYSHLGVPAPTGTVMLPTLALIIGLQLLLSAINLDQLSVPYEPISTPLNEAQGNKA